MWELVKAIPVSFIGLIKVKARMPASREYGGPEGVGCEGPSFGLQRGGPRMEAWGGWPQPVSCLYVSWPYPISQHLQVPLGLNKSDPALLWAVCSPPAQVSYHLGNFLTACVSLLSSPISEPLDKG